MSNPTPEQQQPNQQQPEQNLPEQNAPQKKTPRPRKKKKVEEEKDVIPNMELVVIFIFFASFIVWAVSKCTVTQATYEAEAAIENANQPKDTIALLPKAVLPAIAKPATPAKKVSKTVIKKVTVLYVVLNELKLRKGPTRDSAIVRQFKINEAVDFLGVVTPFKEKINMGKYIAEEPWVKVRSSTGIEGWVYGAGVSYYPPVIQEEEIIENLQ